MKKRVVAACLAAVLGIAPCSVGASQESEVQCISETESSDILLETCTQEKQKLSQRQQQSRRQVQNQKHSQQMERNLQKKFKQNLRQNIRQNIRNRHKNLY